MDPAELRRRNFIPPDDFPHKTVAGATYDSGEYARALDRVLEARGLRRAARRAGAAPRARRRQAARDRPVHLRRAHRASASRSAPARSTRTASSRSRPAPRRRARATRRRGRSSCRGRSACRWTTCASMHSDTRKVPRGMGTMGSRSLQVGGSAMINATREVLAKGRELAAHLLEAAVDDIAGRPRPGPRRRGHAVGDDLVGRAGQGGRRPRQLPEGMEPGLDAINDFETPDSTLSVRRPRRRRRGRHRDRPGQAHPPRHGRRLGQHRQPAAGRGPDPRRHRPGRRAGALRGDRLRRGRQLRRRLADQLRAADRGRAADLRDRAHRDAVAAATRWAPRASASRARSARRPPSGTPSSTRSSHLGVEQHRHAGDADAGVAGDRGGAERGGAAA